jgi:hypothetical protein
MAAQVSCEGSPAAAVLALAPVSTMTAMLVVGDRNRSSDVLGVPAWLASVKVLVVVSEEEDCMDRRVLLALDDHKSLADLRFGCLRYARGTNPGKAAADTVGMPSRSVGEKGQYEVASVPTSSVG